MIEERYESRGEDLGANMFKNGLGIRRSETGRIREKEERKINLKPLSREELTNLYQTGSRGDGVVVPLAKYMANVRKTTFHKMYKILKNKPVGEI